MMMTEMNRLVMYMIYQNWCMSMLVPILVFITSSGSIRICA